MDDDKKLKPEYVFEVSWEVCHKVGGVNHVLQSKASAMKEHFGNHHIMIGPDVWMDQGQNPAFTEDKRLFKSWRLQAESEGIRVRVGRWNIESSPIAILVNYKDFYNDVDAILGKLWDEYKIDSITGDWNYKDFVLFGFAAGKTLESFYNYNLSDTGNVVAVFHEWECASALLYVKHYALPVGTIYVSHSTLMGEAIANANLPLYSNLENYDYEQKAAEYGIKANYSLEKMTVRTADVYTVISDTLVHEAEVVFGRKPDFVTYNGLEKAFDYNDPEFRQKKLDTRHKILEVARAMTNCPISDDAMIFTTDGIYHYRGKGADCFIDIMAKLNKDAKIDRDVVALISMPSANNGPDKELLAKLSGKQSDYTTLTSHYLQDYDNDAIVRRIKECGLDNSASSKVKIIFVPTYLTGNDGIFNVTSFDAIVAGDIALFPSYYDPWGNRIALALSTDTPVFASNLSGLATWLTKTMPGNHPALKIFERNDNNYEEVVDTIASLIEQLPPYDEEKRNRLRSDTDAIVEELLWSKMIKNYVAAAQKAVSIIQPKFKKYKKKTTMQYKKQIPSGPSWNTVMVSRKLPDNLSELETISKNLWWCWNDSAMKLFKFINPELWKQVGGNPIALLDSLNKKQFAELAKNPEFMGRYLAVVEQFNEYMAQKAQRKGPQIAYFCMEYGLDTTLKIYSGGLGILAGDYLKETSDMNVNLMAVGLLYRYGYFTQKLTAQGEQESKYDAQDFMKTPAVPVRDKDGNWVTITIAFPGRTLYARVWRVDVGRTELYLLDTDFEDNLPEDRQITHHLYGGDWENRLKQELLLGVGGIRLLRALGINPQMYHCNEGHAAFTGLERLREYIMEQNLDLQEALEVVRASSLFTTHTPVPAGHDAFDEGLLRKYIGHYPQRLKIDWETLMGLGKLNGSDPSEKFSVSILASNISQNVNGVSWLHGEVSRDILGNMWPGYLPEELHISYVTNGVHYPTWTSPLWKEVHAQVFGEQFKTHHYDKSCFEGIYKVPDEKIWEVRTALKTKLIEAVKEKISDPAASNHYSPRQIVKIKKILRDDVLTIGFARRFATYKRAHLLFRDLDRLDQIVNNPNHPVQFLFAGKAHPADKAGQDLIKMIVDISKQDRFIGKIVFVPDYDITIAKKLVQGVDVWMNTPTRPLEASGTSGEKASMNGVMHFSVLDGWWVEGYKPGAGWALPMEKTYADNNFQDELDAATIYNIIENDIAPAYYNQDSRTGRSSQWIDYVRNTIAQVACNFTTNRMLTDYINQYYDPQSKRYEKMIADDFALAREIATWKKKVRRQWNDVEVISTSRPDVSSGNISLGQTFRGEATLSIGNLLPEDIGVEIIMAEKGKDGKVHIKQKYEMQPVEFKDGIAKYTCDITPESSGFFLCSARLYAKNPLLPHRQDFELVRWL